MKDNIDFFISAIRYEEDNTTKDYIDRFKVHTNYSINISSETLWRRDIIILRIESGKVFYTIKKDGEDFKILNQVFVNNINGEKFLQTQISNTKKNDLGLINVF